MAEDIELCTYEKHHKHKLILFLASMRKYASELKSKKFNVKYYQLNKKNIKFSYEDKLSEFIKNKKAGTNDITNMASEYWNVVNSLIGEKKTVDNNKKKTKRRRRKRKKTRRRR